MSTNTVSGQITGSPGSGEISGSEPQANSVQNDVSAEGGFDPGHRRWIIAAALIALFLGALDALVMSAAMPSIVAELGGMHLYSWVYSAYLLARAVALPVFGKLADLLSTKKLFLFSISLFLGASITAGLAPNMTFLVIARVFQGIGAGGNFALVYITLTDVSTAENRGKTISLASSVWGIASLLGPSMGGFIVTYLSWRWIFFINIAPGLFSLVAIAAYLVEVRQKKKDATLDLAGVITLAVTIMGLLTVFMVGGRLYNWISLPVLALTAITLFAGIGFYLAETRAADPILAIRFFKHRGFSTGNGAVFLASFAMFVMFAYAPLFMQGALGKTPLQVGLALVSLSLGWSLGSLVLGQTVNHLGTKPAALIGAILLVGGSGLTLTFTPATGLITCFWVFMILGFGMGFVALATMMVVQDSLSQADLGVSTTSNQFARTLGGTLGIGICGGFVTASLGQGIASLKAAGAQSAVSPELLQEIAKNVENLFRSEVQAHLPEAARIVLQQAVANGVASAFWAVLFAALSCLAVCALLPRSEKTSAAAD